jgi:hypothetical protein
MADANETGAEVQAHQQSYNGFTQLMLWGTVVSAALGAFVVFMIAS